MQNGYLPDGDKCSEAKSSRAWEMARGRAWRETLERVAWGAPS